eukprot:jgi/Psemu1/24308/gm1.24308_g
MDNNTPTTTRATTASSSSSSRSPNYNGTKRFVGDKMKKNKKNKNHIKNHIKNYIKNEEQERRDQSTTTRRTKVTITTLNPEQARVGPDQIIYPISETVSAETESVAMGIERRTGIGMGSGSGMGMGMASETETQASGNNSSGCSAETQKTVNTNTASTMLGTSTATTMTTTMTMTLLREGIEHYENGEYANALEIFTAVLNMSMNMNPNSNSNSNHNNNNNDDPLVANLLATIGCVYLRQDRHQHAVEALEKSIEMMRRCKEQGATSTATTTATERATATATAMATATATATTTATATATATYAGILNNAGTARSLLGDHRAAFRYYQEALREANANVMTIAMAGDGGKGKVDANNINQKREAAKALYNIGRIGVVMGNSSNDNNNNNSNNNNNDNDNKDHPLLALNALQEALRIETELYGERSTESIDTLHLIGFAHFSMGAFDDAILFFTEALSVATTVHGSLHETVATALVHVGMVLLEKQLHKKKQKQKQKQKDKDKDKTDHSGGNEDSDKDLEDLEGGLRCYVSAKQIGERIGLAANADATATDHPVMRAAVRGASDARRELQLLLSSREGTHHQHQSNSNGKPSSSSSSSSSEGESRNQSPNHNQIRNATTTATTTATATATATAHHHHHHQYPSFSFSRATKKQPRSTSTSTSKPTPRVIINRYDSSRSKIRMVVGNTHVPPPRSDISLEQFELRSPSGGSEYREDPFWELDDNSMVEAMDYCRTEHNDENENDGGTSILEGITITGTYSGPTNTKDPGNASARSVICARL